MRPSERLTLAFSLGLAVITAVERPEGTLLRFSIFLAIASATLLLSRGPVQGATGLIRDSLPTVNVLAIFLLLEPIIEATVPWRLDTTLAALDDRYAARLVEVWRGVFGRPDGFTDAIYLAYCSYYFLPFVVASIAWRHGQYAFERVMLTLLLGFYSTFIGYLLLPAAGPRLPIGIEAQVLGGGITSDAVRAFLRTAELTTFDAFPSGHTSLAVLSAVCGSRLVSRNATILLWLWAAAVVFSTVYIRVHYAIDVFAGFALAVLVLGVIRAAASRERQAATSAASGASGRGAAGASSCSLRRRSAAASGAS